VNVPMYLVIRRTNTAFTLCTEFLILSKLPVHNAIYIAVSIICGGAILAGWKDLMSANDEFWGYALVLFHNVCTCSHTVSLNFVKRKLPAIDPFYFLLIIQLLTWPFLLGYAVFELLRDNGKLPFDSFDAVTDFAHYIFVLPATFDVIGFVDGMYAFADAPVDSTFAFVAGLQAFGLAKFDAIALYMTSTVYSVLSYDLGWLYIMFGHSTAEYLDMIYALSIYDPAVQVFLLIALTVLTGATNVIANPMTSIKHSALSQSVAGNTKDIVQTAIGGYFFSDYVFTYLNFSGIMLSFVGCGLYVYVKYLENSGRSSVLDKLGKQGAEKVGRKMKSVGKKVMNYF